MTFALQSMAASPPLRMQICNQRCGNLIASRIVRPNVLFSRTLHSRKRALQLVRASAETETEKKEPGQEQKEKLLADMKKGGVDKGTALKVLKRWEETGATDPASLTKMLRRKSLDTVLAILVQAVLDAGAAYGGVYLGSYLAAAENIPGHWFLSIAANFVGSWFAVGVVLDLFTLGAVTASSIQFQTNSAAFLAAVREIAGQETGLNVIDKATQAVNTVKVFTALTSMSEMLQEEASKTGVKSTLGDLSTYLLLSQAAEKYGFDYEAEGLSADEAGSIANLFARFDLNDDGRLDLSELQKLSTELNAGLTEEEVKEGFKLLDSDKSGSLELPEFVRWYQKKHQDYSEATSRLEAEESSVRRFRVLEEIMHGFIRIPRAVVMTV